MYFLKLIKALNKNEKTIRNKPKSCKKKKSIFLNTIIDFVTDL